jgi:hypothetical protein
MSTSGRHAFQKVAAIVIARQPRASVERVSHDDGIPRELDHDILVHGQHPTDHHHLACWIHGHHRHHKTVGAGSRRITLALIFRDTIRLSVGILVLVLNV